MIFPYYGDGCTVYTDTTRIERKLGAWTWTTWDDETLILRALTF